MVSGGIALGIVWDGSCWEGGDTGMSTPWVQPLLLGEEERPREGLCPSVRSEKFHFLVVFFNDEKLSLLGGIPFSSQGIKIHIFSFGQAPRGLGLGVLFL